VIAGPQGKVWLVGAGPGDPGLITVRGLELLRAADAVVHDRLVSTALLAQVPAHAERHDVGKSPGGHNVQQEEINVLLVCLARAGKRVVRLKGGDPFVFGRGGEEALALQGAAVAWEVVPGVSSAIAAPAYAGIPVTHRHLAASFAVTTGHEGLKRPGLAHADTLVVVMAVEHLEAVVGKLLSKGRSPKTPAAIVQAASTPQQRTITGCLGTIVGIARRERAAAPATLVVGPTVALGEQLAWFERRPLFGRRVLVARTRTEPSALAGLLSDAGAQVCELPTRRDALLRDTRAADVAVRRLADRAYAWALFGGADTVAALWARLDALGLDARSVRARVCAFGAGTLEALRQRGVRPDWCPETYHAATVVAGLASLGIAGCRLLLPHIEPATRLMDGLAAHGAVVDAVPVGRVETDSDGDVQRLQQLLTPPGLDLLVLPASRAVEEIAGLLRGASAVLGDTRVVCIGPKTADSARAVGWHVDAVAEDSSREGLVDVAIRLVSAARVSVAPRGLHA